MNEHVVMVIALSLPPLHTPRIVPTQESVRIDKTRQVLTDPSGPITLALDAYSSNLRLRTQQKVLCTT